MCHLNVGISYIFGLVGHFCLENQWPDEAAAEY